MAKKPVVRPFIDENGVILWYSWNGRRINPDEFEKRIKNLILAGDPEGRRLAVHQYGLGWDDAQVNAFKEQAFKARREQLFKGLPTSYNELLAERSRLQDDLEDATPDQRAKIQERINRINGLLPRFSAGQVITETQQRRARRQAGEAPKGGRVPVPAAVTRPQGALSYGIEPPFSLKTGAERAYEREVVEPVRRQMEQAERRRFAEQQARGGLQLRLAELNSRPRLSRAELREKLAIERAIRAGKVTSPVARVLGTAVVGAGEGVFAFPGTERLIPGIRQELAIEKARMAPESGAERAASVVAGIGGSLVGWRFGPAGLVVMPLTVPIGARAAQIALRAAGPAVGGRLAPLVTQLVRSGADGLLFGVADMVNEHPYILRLANRDPNAATLEILKRLGRPAAEFAAFGTVLHGLLAAGSKGADFWRAVRAVRRGEAPLAGIAPIPASRVNEQAWRTGADDLDVRDAIQGMFGTGPAPSPRPAPASTPFADDLAKMAALAEERLRVKSVTFRRTKGGEMVPERITMVAEEPPAPTLTPALEKALRKKTRGLRGTGTSPREIRAAAEKEGIDLKRLHAEERGELGVPAGLTETLAILHQHPGRGITGGVPTEAARRDFVRRLRHAAAQYLPTALTHVDDAEAALARGDMRGLTVAAERALNRIHQYADDTARATFTAGRLLRGEEGAVALDVLTGQFIPQIARSVIEKRRNLHDLGMIGAVKMAQGARTPADWTAVMREHVERRLPGEWVQVFEANQDRVYRAALSIFENNMRQYVRRLPGLGRLMELRAKGEDAVEWYPVIRRELPLIVPEQDMDVALAMLALNAQGVNIRTNVANFVKHYVQYVTGQEIRGGMYNADENVRAYLRGEDRGFGPKIRDFQTAVRREIRPEERAAIYRGAAQDQIVFAESENVVTADRRMFQVFFPKEYAEQLKRGRVVPNPYQRALIQEETRRFAEYLTRLQWAEIPPTNVQARVRARVVPADTQAMLWAGIGEESATAAARAGKAVHTSEDFIQYMQRNPRFMRAVWRALDTRPVPLDEAGLVQMLRGEQYAIIGSEPGFGKKALPLREGENYVDALRREVYEAGFRPEQVIMVRGRWRDQDTGDVAEEVSYLIRGMDAVTARKIAARRGQTAFITEKGLVTTKSGDYQPFTGKVVVGEPATAGDHSVIYTVNGPLPFSMDFAQEPSGRLPALMPAWQRARELLAGAASETGGAVPERIKLRWDPAAGKFIAEGGAHVPGRAGSVEALVQRFEQEYKDANLRHMLKTGQPLTPPEPTINPANPAESVNAFRRLEEMAAEAGASAKVAGILTNEKNVFGNAINTVFRVGEEATAGALDFVLSGGGRLRPRERLVREALVDAVGMFGALEQGWRNMLRALATEHVPKVAEPGIRYQAIPGAAGKLVRLPFRPLTALDAFFRTVNEGGIIRSEAVRQALRERAPNVAQRAAELALQPTTEMAKAAESRVAESVFQQSSNRLARIGYAFRDYIPGGKILFPFIRISTNLLSYTARRTPLGLVEAVGRGKTLGEREDAIARALLGSSLMTLFAWYALQGKITGSGPADPGRRKLLEAQGWQQESVRIGGRWVSYRGFEPLASFLRFAGNYAENVRAPEEERQNVFWMVSKSAGEALLENTFVTQARDMLDALVAVVRLQGDVAGRLERLGEQVATGFIPTVVKEITRATDPVVREAKKPGERLQRVIPGLSKTLRPTLDVLGRPVVREGGPLARVFLPQTRTPAEDPLIQELVRLGVTLPEPAKTARRKGEKVERTPEQLWALKAARGGQFNERLRRLIESPRWARRSDDKKRQILERYKRRIVRRASREVED